MGENSKMHFMGENKSQYLVKQSLATFVLVSKCAILVLRRYFLKFTWHWTVNPFVHHYKKTCKFPTVNLLACLLMNIAIAFKFNFSWLFKSF